MLFVRVYSLLFLLAAASLLPAQAKQPRAYDVRFTARPVHVDGKLDEAAWKQAPWTTDFIDITGDGTKKPLYRTRVKMLWDDRFLYIAAELQEPDVHGTLTEHDSVIFHDNDFEVFLKPVLTGERYYEFEMNALNTTWDLSLNRPYRLGGKADNGWESGVRSAVSVQGSLNRSDDRDRGWTLEIAFPLDGFLSLQEVPAPVDGTVWRANFSRVEWLAGHPREENWVWSSQDVVNMHIPERWGALRFVKQ